MTGYKKQVRILQREAEFAMQTRLLLCLYGFQLSAPVQMCWHRLNCPEKNEGSSLLNSLAKLTLSSGEQRHKQHISLIWDPIRKDLGTFEKLALKEIFTKCFHRLSMPPSPPLPQSGH